MPGTIAKLWAQVHDAFQDVDCILHAGDLHVTDVIDELETIAPTFVSEGNGDLDVRHPRLQGTWVGRFAGCEIAMVHRFPTPRRADEAKLEKSIGRHFGQVSPDVIIYGHTHLAEAHAVGNRLYINPGSATLPNNQSTRLGTVGILDVGRSSTEVTLYQLGEPHAEAIDSVNLVLSPSVQ